MVFQFYGYIWDLLANILKKNIGRLKIDQNSWKYKKNIIEI